MRKIISLILICLLLPLVPLCSFAYEMPQEIRVGLFYASSAKAEYSVFSENGFTITGGGGTYITEDSAAHTLTVKKDTFYHAAVNENFSDASGAFAAASALKAAGLDAFYMLDGKEFSVYVGSFETEQEAVSAQKEIETAGFSAKTVSPISSSVIVYSGNTPWAGSAKSGIRTVPFSSTSKINDKEYRGYFEFYRDEKSDMAAVNVVNIEDYLMGVVPREVSASWPQEAVKAQAIVARTYAVTNMNKFLSYGFNVNDTTQSQVYGGVLSEHELSNAAVLATKGKLVMYNGLPAEVFFFSSSGGMTESVENVWGGAPRDYLVSVSDPYENPAEASYANWTITLSPEDVSKKLSASGIDIGEVTDITVDETSLSGRSLKTTIHGTNGSHTFTYEKIRTALGLYSSLFTVSREGSANPVLSILSASGSKLSSLDGLSAMSNTGLSICIGSITAIGESGTKTYESTSGTGNFVLSGKGWGHGIGMSQWGAKGMADAGFTCEQIVKHYFKGTEVS